MSLGEREAATNQYCAFTRIGDLTPGTSLLTIVVDGTERDSIVVVPEAVTSGAVPLVIAFHGNGDTKTNFVAFVTNAGGTPAPPLCCTTSSIRSVRR